MTWSIRRASLRDRDDLAALCAAAVGPDDYALSFLEDHILRAVVHIALAGDRVAGMMAYRPCIDGSGWLAMARTHPDFRRQGAARALLESFVGMARASGIPVLRLWSEAANAEARSAVTSSGFHEVARFTRIVAAAARGPPKGERQGFDESLWRQVESSSIVPKGRGYVPHAWYFVPASRPVVFALAAKGHFWGWDGRLVAYLDTPAGDPLEFALWAGPAQDLFAEVCRQAGSDDRTEAHGFVPRDRNVLSEARHAGFRTAPWGREAVLYELAVSPAIVRRRARPTQRRSAKRTGHSHAGVLHEDRWNV